MTHAETISGTGRERIKVNDGGSEFKCDIRIFVNATMYPYVQQK
jgi:hypothetical protein